MEILAKLVFACEQEWSSFLYFRNGILYELRILFSPEQLLSHYQEVGVQERLEELRTVLSSAPQPEGAIRDPIVLQGWEAEVIGQALLGRQTELMKRGELPPMAEQLRSTLTFHSKMRRDGGVIICLWDSTHHVYVCRSHQQFTSVLNRHPAAITSEHRLRLERIVHSISCFAQAASDQPVHLEGYPAQLLSYCLFVESMKGQRIA